MLKLGFIGGGLNSAIGVSHRIAAELDKKWQVVAGCFSRDPATNLETGQEFALAEDRIYAERSELLLQEKGKLDAIVILTPTPSHANIILEALNAGFNVICEKSIATSAKELEAIEEKLKKKENFLAVIYNYTGYPLLRELKQMIDEGMFGKLSQIHVEMPQETFIRLDKNNTPIIPQEWRLSDYDLPTISLDLGVHLHHLISFLSSETPVELVATADSFGNFSQVVDNINCLARYTNNLLCNIWYSKAALGHRNGLKIRIYGSKASASWYQAEPETIEFTNNKGLKQIIDRLATPTGLASSTRYNRFKIGHPAGFIEAFANHYYDIAESLKDFQAKQTKSNSWVFGYEEAKEGIILLEAISRSAKNKSWEKVV